MMRSLGQSLKKIIQPETLQIDKNEFLKKNVQVNHGKARKKDKINKMWDYVTKITISNVNGIYLHWKRLPKWVKEHALIYMLSARDTSNMTISGWKQKDWKIYIMPTVPKK